MQFENKAELKFDMNYIIENSPTKTRKQLVTIKDLQLEKFARNLEFDKEKHESQINTYINRFKVLKEANKEDSFFDFKGIICNNF